MNDFDIKSLKTPDFIKRYAGNPIISADMMPYESVQTYNAGFTKFNGKYVCVFRNDYNRCQENFMTAEVKINLGFATSDDGIHWEVANKPCWSVHTDEIWHVYDPRLTVIDGKCYVCFAMDTWHGVRGGVAVTEDFDKFEILSLAAPENRNMVLFPEKINNMYMRLERPMPVYGRLPNMRESFNTCFSKCAQFFGRYRFFLLDFFIFYIMFKSIASEHHQRSQMRDRKICQM
jgi:beta-1,4-mannooligosaccharide/beta-1,4-mannosyl-N-acetylglucosamine phosphorylase